MLSTGAKRKKNDFHKCFDKIKIEIVFNTVKIQATRIANGKIDGFMFMLKIRTKWLKFSNDPFIQTLIEFGIYVAASKSRHF